ncbi:hypothetical protein ABZ897_57860 [Nonomuraea sp. NPDC046802]|uniref:hypothetical protein n=1 Tax=Nonomuraea sp. NPDC046802 TaxID=3154919 RepID=UPI0033C65C97
MTPIPRRRGWIIAAAIFAVAVIGSAGLAIANPYDNTSNEAACAVWDKPGTQEYERCLDNLNAQSVGEMIPGSQPGTPTISATSIGDDYNPPLYFCRDSGKSHLASTKPPKDCKDPLVCRWSKTDRKYHCENSKEISTSPPGNICKTNPHFACAGEVAITTTTVFDDQRQPPTASSRPTDAVASAPGTPDPTGQALPDQTDTPEPSSSTTARATPTATSSPSPTIAADDPVGQALAQAQKQSLRIWLESDLVNVWKAGPAQLKVAAERLKLYANQSGVVGVKFAYDLGLRGFNSTDEIARFVREASQVLRATLPAGRQIAVDVVIPELGCGAHQACVAAMRKAHPLTTLAAVERFVLSGGIDAVNISPGLFSKEYEPFKIQPATAISNVWLRIRLLSWKTKMPGLFIGSREIGLAHADETRSNKGDADEVARERDAANKLVNERVDVPLARGVDHVVLWTWKQSFSGQTWRLTDSGGGSNAVWDALRTRQNLLRLSVAYNPREPETNVADDVQRIAEVASAIFIFVP